MTRFLDVRLNPVGGPLATSVAINQGTSLSDYVSLDKEQLRTDIQGRHVLIATNGYNVSREGGIACLSNWEQLVETNPQPNPPSAQPFVFVGLLWPGDSIWAHGLDYPEETKIANEAGCLIAPFINDNFGNAASISFASHSLGARLILETIANMSLPVRRVTIMAGAIDDNCLNTEFRIAANSSKVGKTSVLASKKDEVLSALFPLGNLIGGIIAEGHPWWHAALGHCGPSKPRPGNFVAPFQIPDNWNYGHHDYLRVDQSSPTIHESEWEVPPNGTPEPAGGIPGWQEAWSAAFCSGRFR